ncbi:redox-active disulfide protein 2 [Dehalogenimonas sp. WBC-2]|nr:redox-active disulfide protein 2 [Dehalogenimonas sp. WBC-2]
MIIKILGTGCAKCKQLEALTRQAVIDNGIDAEIIKVTELKDIMSYPITMTPALVIDEKVVFSGRVPGKVEILAEIKKRP